MRRGILGVVFAALLCASAFAQFGDQMKSAAKDTEKFGNVPGLPTCTTMAVQNGDPMKGAAVLLIKATSGCVVPWHWHTANEQLMIVSGNGKGEMKSGGAPAMLKTGDYIYLPAKQAHQFTCQAACTFFLTSDAVFDIHYVDKDGKEIPPDQALKAQAKPAAKPAPKKEGAGKP